MRFLSVLSALSLFSSALAITITEPTSSTTWDFSTPQTIKFTSSPNDPPYVSIILLNPSTNFQIKIADNVQTQKGEYTTQPDPSVPNGTGYKIEIIDSSGPVATSQGFTVEKGASSGSSPASLTSSAASSAISTATTSGLSTVTVPSSTGATASTTASSTGNTPASTSASSGKATSSGSPVTGAAASIHMGKDALAFAAILCLALLFL
ncbi:hypothetical protein VTN77DRAFT_6373 [Rasamsonia byssochlamydoides]|uniref:uncharacterized protein n=1 Tax=Rasamsonia byssochlamydoides TaxID=89139 RepID=UPI0037429B8C